MAKQEIRTMADDSAIAPENDRGLKEGPIHPTTRQRPPVRPKQFCPKCGFEHYGCTCSPPPSGSGK